MTGDAVRQLLAEISAKEQTATEGPWAVDSTPGFEYHVRTGGTAAVAPSTAVPIADAALDADATFIADARSSVPRLVAALTGTPEKPGVLDLHKFSEAENCCAECEAWWPCPTYRAVAVALEEQP